MVDSLKTVERQDIPFEALIEGENYLGKPGQEELFEEVGKYISKIVSELDSDIALRGMISYIQKYCEPDFYRYIADYSECIKHYWEMAIILQESGSIKGGRKYLRNKTCEYCEMLWKCLNMIKRYFKNIIFN